ncbi:class F sortase [Rothia sp. AR01]|uniref:Class F sortase n=1 Tax=Rothia santali TaxID=2949643 RepID=A0A9X2KGT6_9MICC|nr:class F sortase [Rothia santali]
MPEPRHRGTHRVRTRVIALPLLAAGIVSAWWIGTPAPDEQASSAHVQVASDGTKQAPAPERTYRASTCDLAPQRGATPAPLSWEIPAIGQRAGFQPSGKNGASIELPDAPAGTIYADDAPLGAEHGAVLQAGHVDYAPGVLSEAGGELSPWGYLHQIPECSHVYQADEAGTVHEYVVTDVYTVAQDDLPAQDELFRLDGDPALYMITCSGPSVEDAGGAFAFNYSHNLIVKAVPAQTA